MSNGDIILRAGYAPMSFDIALYASGGTRDYRWTAKPLSVEKRVDKDRHLPHEPFIVLEDAKQLQDMFDDLWRLGLRPSARSDEYKAQLETMRGHLDDMRALVFKDNRIINLGEKS